MTETSKRQVTLARESKGVYVATNARGGTLRFGPKTEDGFTPVELLLAAVAGCSGIDVDYMTSRRAEPLRFDAVSEATQEKGDDGNILRDVTVTFHLEFPPGVDGDKARDRIDAALKASLERTCTVSRTLEAATPVVLRKA
jgi:putative redox protein